MPPPDPNPTNLQQAIADAAANPQSATVDGQSATAHNLNDLIAADKYLASKAVAVNPWKAIKRVKILPGGTADGGVQ